MNVKEKVRAFNILDFIEENGEDATKDVLSDFSCPKNAEVENFVKKNAIDFAKQKKAVTYLIINDYGELTGIFTLTHKAVEIDDSILSSSTRKRIQRYAKLDEDTHKYMVSAFLIAQLGKNLDETIKDKPSGDALIERSIEILRKAQRLVGGGMVYLDCENKKPLLDFYQSETNRFQVFSERHSETDNIDYIQLLRFF